MFLAFGVAQPLIKIMEFADHIMAITTTMGKVDEIMGWKNYRKAYLPSPALMFLI